MDFNAIAKPYLDMFPDCFSYFEKKRLEIALDTKDNHRLFYLRPADAVMAIYENQKGVIPKHYASTTRILLTFAMWRIGGKHVVELAFDMEQFLAKTTLPQKIPLNTLLNLPFLCAYIALKNNPLFKGFFVRMDSYSSEKDFAFQFLAQGLNDKLYSCFIKSDFNGNFENEDLIQSLMNTIYVEGAREDRNLRPDDIRLLLSVALYLCAANAEITSKTAAAPTIPTLPRNKRAIAPHQPTEWLCGERIGAAIRASAQREANDPTGTGASKRPHIRRAHWHTYRVGVGKANTILKWIHPLAINADDGSDMPVTTRKV